MVQWMQGFISASGYYGYELNRTDASALEAWMDNYCKENPLESFGDAVHKLVETLRKK